MTPETRERGLYKNGRLWWTRVPHPPAAGVVPRSTGTANLRLANRVQRMVRSFAERRDLWPWLTLAADGEIPLLTLYEHHAAGTLHKLREEREAAASAADDADVEPWVDRWDREELALKGLAEQTRTDYVRQVRALVPSGVSLPRSTFTEGYVKDKLLSLRDGRTGALLSGSTRRRYLAAWGLFTRYAKKRVPLVVDPLADLDDWRPANGSPRSVFWDHETTLKVLSKMEGEPRVMMTLVLGSGIELGALLDMRGRHVGPGKANAPMHERTIVAPGSKNEHREERTIFVDAWAWPALVEHARKVPPRGKLWSTGEGVLRSAFYDAQVAAGLIHEPKVSKSGKKLWRAVKPHTIHDARHTYCVVRSLGLDGEKRQDAKFCSMQLGHADEQMVLRIYAKANLRERLRLIELREAREASKQRG